MSWFPNLVHNRGRLFFSDYFFRGIFKIDGHSCVFVELMDHLLSFVFYDALEFTLMLIRPHDQSPKAPFFNAQVVVKGSSMVAFKI